MLSLVARPPWRTTPLRLLVAAVAHLPLRLLVVAVAHLPLRLLVVAAHPRVIRVDRVEPRVIRVDQVDQVDQVGRAHRDLLRVSPGDHVRMSFVPKTSQD